MPKFSNEFLAQFDNLVNNQGSGSFPLSENDNAQWSKLDDLYFGNKQKDYSKPLSETSEEDKENMSTKEMMRKKKEEREANYDKPMEGLDWLFGKMAQGAEWINSLTGAEEAEADIADQGWNPATIGEKAWSTILGIPAGIGSMPLEGASKLYEAATGAPVSESAGDKMANYELSDQQRQAAAIQGLSDIAMMYGPGKLAKEVGGLAKAAKTGIGIEEALAAARGEGSVLKEIGSEAAGMGALGAIGGAAGVARGSEETKDNTATWEEMGQGALQGGLHGAAMGAVFKAIPRALSYAKGKVGEKVANKISPDITENPGWKGDPVSDTAPGSLENLQSDMLLYESALPSKEKELVDQYEKSTANNRVTSAQIQTAEDIRINHVKEDAANVMHKIRAFDPENNPHPGSNPLDFYARKFGADANEMQKYIDNADIKGFADYMNECYANLQKQNGGQLARVSVFKNPATNPGGYNLYHDGFTYGNAGKIQIHDMVARRMNADFDGDLMNISIRDWDVKEGKSIHDDYTSRSGKARFDFLDGGLFDNKWFAGKATDRQNYAKERILNVLNNYDNDLASFYAANGNNARFNSKEALAEHFANCFEQNKDNTYKNDANTWLCGLFNGLKGALERHYTDSSNDKALGHQRANEMMSNIIGDTLDEGNIHRIGTELIKITDRCQEYFDKLRNDRNDYETKKSGPPTVVKKGRQEGSSAANFVIDFFANPDAADMLSSENNNVFRIDSAIKFFMGKRNDKINPDMYNASVDDFNKISLIAIGMEAQGEHVKTSYETWYNQWVMKQALTHETLTGDFGDTWETSTKSFALFMSKIEGAHEHFRKQYNESYNAVTDNGKIKIPHFELPKIKEGGPNDIYKILTDENNQSIKFKWGDGPDQIGTINEMIARVRRNPDLQIDMNNSEMGGSSLETSDRPIGTEITKLANIETNRIENQSNTLTQHTYDLTKKMCDQYKNIDVQVFEENGRIDNVVMEHVHDWVNFVEGIYQIFGHETFNDRIIQEWLNNPRSEKFRNAVRNNDAKTANEALWEFGITNIAEHLYGDVQKNNIEILQEFNKGEGARDTERIRALLLENYNLMSAVCNPNCSRAIQNHWHEGIAQKHWDCLRKLLSDDNSFDPQNEADVGEYCHLLDDLFTIDRNSSLEKKLTNFINLPKASEDFAPSKEELLLHALCSPGEVIEDIGVRNRVKLSKKAMNPNKDLEIQTAKFVSGDLTETLSTWKATGRTAADIAESFKQMYRAARLTVKDQLDEHCVRAVDRYSSLTGEKASTDKITQQQYSWTAELQNVAMKALGVLDKYTLGCFDIARGETFCGDMKSIGAMLFEPEYADKKMNLIMPDGTLWQGTKVDFFALYGLDVSHGIEVSHWEALAKKQPKLFEALYPQTINIGNSQNPTTISYNINTDASLIDIDKGLKKKALNVVNDKEGNLTFAHMINEADAKIANLPGRIATMLSFRAFNETPTLQDNYAPYVEKAKRFCRDLYLSAQKDLANGNDITNPNSLTSKQLNKIEKAIWRNTQALVSKVTRDPNSLGDTEIYINHALNEFVAATQDRANKKALISTFIDQAGKNLSDEEKAALNSMYGDIELSENAPRAMEHNLSQLWLQSEWLTRLSKRIEEKTGDPNGVADIISQQWSSIFWDEFSDNEVINSLPKDKQDNLLNMLETNVMDTLGTANTVASSSFIESESLKGVSDIAALSNIIKEKAEYNNFSIDELITEQVEEILNNDKLSGTKKATDLANAINDNILQQKLNNVTDEIRSDKIVLNAFDTYKEFVFDPIINTAKKAFVDNKYETNEEMKNAIGQYNNQMVDEDWASLNMASNQNTINAMRAISQVGTNSIPTNVGLFGTAPTYNYIALVFDRLNKKEPYRQYSLPETHGGENTVRSLMNLFYEPAHTNESKFDWTKAFSAENNFYTDALSGDIFRGDAPKTGLFINQLNNHRTIWPNMKIRATKFYRDATGNSTADGWVKLTERDAKKIMEYVYKQSWGNDKYQLAPDDIILGKHFENIREDASALIEFLMEARILKIKKAFNADAAAGSVEPLHWSDEIIKVEPHNIVGDGPEAFGEMLNQWDRQGDLANRYILCEMMSHNIDKKNCPLLNHKNDYVSLDSEFICIFLTTQVETIDGKTHLLSEKQICDATRDGFVTLADGTTLQANEIKSYKIFLRDPETMFGAMEKRAAREMIARPDMAEAEVRDAALQEWLTPTSPTENNGKGLTPADLINTQKWHGVGRDKMSYSRRVTLNAMDKIQHDLNPNRDIKNKTLQSILSRTEKPDYNTDNKESRDSILKNKDREGKLNWASQNIFYIQSITGFGLPSKKNVFHIYDGQSETTPRSSVFASAEGKKQLDVLKDSLRELNLNIGGADTEPKVHSQFSMVVRMNSNTKNLNWEKIYKDNMNTNNCLIFDKESFDNFKSWYTDQGFHSKKSPIQNNGWYMIDPRDYLAYRDPYKYHQGTSEVRSYEDIKNNIVVVSLTDMMTRLKSHLGDASTGYTKDGLAATRFNGADVEKINLGDINKLNNSDIRLLFRQEEIANIPDERINYDWILNRDDSISETNLRGMVDALRNGSNLNQYNLNRDYDNIVQIGCPRDGQILAMARVGNEYIPIVYRGNPSAVSEVFITAKGSQIHVTSIGERSLLSSDIDSSGSVVGGDRLTTEESQSIKTYLAEHAYKGTGASLDREQYILENGDVVHLLEDRKSNEGRMPKGTILRKIADVVTPYMWIIRDTKMEQCNISLLKKIKEAAEANQGTPLGRWWKENSILFSETTTSDAAFKPRPVGKFTNAQKEALLEFHRKNLIQEVVKTSDLADPETNWSPTIEAYQGFFSRCLAADFNPFWLLEKQALGLPTNISEIKTYFGNGVQCSRILHHLTHVNGGREVIHSVNIEDPTIEEYLKNHELDGNVPMINGRKVIHHGEHLETGEKVTYQEEVFFSTPNYEHGTNTMTNTPAHEGRKDLNQEAKAEMGGGGKANMKDLIKWAATKKNSISIIDRQELWGVNKERNRYSFDRYERLDAFPDEIPLAYNTATYIEYPTQQHLTDHFRLFRKFERDGVDYVYDPKEPDKKYSLHDDKVTNILDQHLRDLNLEVTLSNRLYFWRTMCDTIARTCSVQGETEPMSWKSFISAAKNTADTLSRGEIPGYNKNNGSNIVGVEGLRYASLITNENTIKWVSQVTGRSEEEIRNHALNNLLYCARQFQTEENRGTRSILLQNLCFKASQLGSDLSEFSILNEMTYWDLMENHAEFRSKAFPGVADSDAFVECQKVQTQITQAIQNGYKDNKFKTYKVDSAEYGQIVERKKNKDNVTGSWLRNATTLSKLCGLPYTGVALQNAIDKPINYGGQSIMLRLGQKGIGVMKWSDCWQIPDELLNKIAHDKGFNDCITAAHMAKFYGEEQFLVKFIADGGTIKEYMARLKRTQNTFDRAYNLTARLSTAADVAHVMRNKNFIRMFIKTATEDGWGDHLFGDMTALRTIEGPDGKPIQERYTSNRFTQLAESNPEELATKMLFGDNSFPVGNSGEKSLNIILKGDLAHNNVVTHVLEHLLGKNQWFDFLFVTLANKYVRASTNTLGRSLNWFAPTSTLNFLGAKLMASEKFMDCMRHHGWLKEMFGMPESDSEFATLWQHDMDIIKGYNNLREAVLTDAMHMTLPSLACALAAGPLLQPPEDEDKWCNHQEWTVCGLKIGQAWWLDDILGVAAPLACFWKSAELGRPDMTILWQGLGQHLANNPVLKIADCVGAVMQPDALLGEIESAANTYHNAPGGAPDGMEYLLGSLPGMGLTYVSQFFTPGIVKEAARMFQPYETSYRNIWEESGTGALTEEGRQGKTQKTSFADSQIRKITKGNPILGMLCDALPGFDHNTSYCGWNMPRQELLEPAELNFMKRYSILDDNGKEKSDREKQAIAFELINALNSSPNLQELKQMGWHLDTETRNYVGDVLKDLWQKTNDDFSEKQKLGYLNPYVLGDGDYEKGKQIYNEYYKAFVEQKQYWRDLYENKLLAKELNGPIQKYNRLNTTYAKDAKGNIYATGFREGLGGLLAPLLYAPEHDTAGKEGDYATLSAVTGEGMYDEAGNGLRALVPEATNLGFKYPQPEKWTNEYSANYGTQYSSNTGKGGYGSRSGGGGGGSHAIHSTSPHVNIPNAATPRAASLKDVQYDYLRPNFEVAGSSNAQKRDTI